jgi:hypothetical protein
LAGEAHESSSSQVKSEPHAPSAADAAERAVMETMERRTVFIGDDCSCGFDPVSDRNEAHRRCALPWSARFAREFRRKCCVVEEKG